MSKMIKGKRGKEGEKKGVMMLLVRKLREKKAERKGLLQCGKVVIKCSGNGAKSSARCVRKKVGKSQENGEGKDKS